MQEEEGESLLGFDSGVHELLVVGERLRDDQVCATLLEVGQVRGQRVAPHADDTTGEVHIPSHNPGPFIVLIT